MNNKKEIGNLGEDLAVKYLLSNGYKILERNFLVWGGEIDIIAKKTGIIYFFEVKTSTGYINASDHMNYKKIQKVQKTAIYYMNYRLKLECPFKIMYFGVNLNSQTAECAVEIFEI